MSWSRIREIKAFTNSSFNSVTIVLLFKKLSAETVFTHGVKFRNYLKLRKFRNRCFCNGVKFRKILFILFNRSDRFLVLWIHKRAKSCAYSVISVHVVSQRSYTQFSSWKLKTCVYFWDVKPIYAFKCISIHSFTHFFFSH